LFGTTASNFKTFLQADLWPFTWDGFYGLLMLACFGLEPKVDVKISGSIADIG
jgi:hypothetical protein